MKKYIVVASLILVAASCSKQAPVSVLPAPTPTSSPVMTPTPDALQTFSNPNLGFSIKYSKDFSVNTFYKTKSQLCDNPDALCLLMSPAPYLGTVFESAGVSVNVLKDISSQAKCDYISSTKDVAPSPIIINGISFKTLGQTSEENGSIKKVQTFHTFHNSYCYEILLKFYSSKTQPQFKSGLSRFDEAPVWDKLKAVLNTFKFIDHKSI